MSISLLRNWLGACVVGLAISVSAAAQPVAAQPAAAQPAAAQPAAVEPIAAPAAATPAAVVPTQVKTGLYVTQLLDFDMARRSFNVTFWAWYLHNNEKYNPIETIEVVNAKLSNVRFSSHEVKGIHYNQAKYSATVSEDWNIKNYPFDRQDLHVYLEDGVSDAGTVQLIADQANSKIDGSIRVPGWRITGFAVAAKKVTYYTAFGDPTLNGDSSYSRIEATISVQRDGVRLLISMYIGFFVAFLLSMLTFLLDFDAMAGSRIGLSAAAVFAAIGNKYAVDNVLPPAAGFTLSDVIEATSFGSIVLAAATVVVIQLWRKNHPRFTERFNQVIALITALGFFGLNGWMIALAVG